MHARVAGLGEDLPLLVASKILPYRPFQCQKRGRPWLAGTTSWCDLDALLVIGSNSVVPCASRNQHEPLGTCPRSAFAWVGGSENWEAERKAEAREKKLPPNMVADGADESFVDVPPLSISTRITPKFSNPGLAR